MQQRSFNNEEMREILSRAMRKQYWDLERISIADLEKAASELGIDRQALADAVADWETNRDAELKELETRKRKRQGVVMHGVAYVLVNAALLFDTAYGGGDYPMHWIILGWGIGLIAHILQDWFGWNFEDENTK